MELSRIGGFRINVLRLDTLLEKGKSALPDASLFVMPVRTIHDGNPSMDFRIDIDSVEAEFVSEEHGKDLLVAATKQYLDICYQDMQLGINDVENLFAETADLIYPGHNYTAVFLGYQPDGSDERYACLVSADYLLDARHGEGGIEEAIRYMHEMEYTVKA